MHRRLAGFSLVELMITLVVLTMVVGALLVIMVGSNRSKAQTEGLVESQQAARTALEIVAHDIRSAGYGVDKDAIPAQPAFAYVDSVDLILYGNLQPVAYRTSTQPSSTNPPLSPAPAGTPLPYFVENGGSVYPTGYRVPSGMGGTKVWRTGAEMVRYTLDINDDGAVNSADQNDSLATEAARSANPNDFVLARMIYGDSAGVVPTANNNGGTIEKVGLVRGPGAGVPPMFTVYLGSDPAPWNWSSGAVPAARLKDISRITINLTAESRRPDDDGQYRRTTLSTEVNSLRNVPEAGLTSYQVDGYIFNDVNSNQIKDAGEPGIKDVVVRLGTAGVAQTNAAGYYLMRAAPGMYVLKEEVPEGYNPVGPDSIIVNFLTTPANLQHDFGNAKRVGGWIYARCYKDDNDNLVHDTGEPWIPDVAVTTNSATKQTDGFGEARFFVPPGTWAVSADAPDSFLVKSTNPVTVTVANNDSIQVLFALDVGGKGTISGMVFRDTDRDGVYDAGEPGIANAWVGVTKSAGLEVMGSGLTTSSGTYSIEVPNNMPDAINPYQISVQVPNGYFPTSPTTISNVWIADAQTISGQNFGVQNFQIISLLADRVLSLSSGELMEKDWQGADNSYSTKSHKDVDLILGSEYVSNPNVSVWFNDYNNSPLFASTPTYQVNAQRSVLSLAVGRLDVGTTPERPDVVTGIEKHTTGNFVVWLTQNSSGNFGYLPTSGTYYMTQDNGDVYSVLMSPMDANTSNDLLVGTKSPTITEGSIEVWLNNGNGAFVRNEIVPSGWGMSPGSLGAVRGMALADFDADNDSDLVVVTRTGGYNGKAHFFERIGNTFGLRYLHRLTVSLAGEATAVAVVDVDGDGRKDVVTTSQKNTAAGKIEYWHNNGAFVFNMARDIDFAGIPLSLVAGDFGGLATRSDLAVGFRTDDVSFSGGVRIYFLDSGTLPSSGTDPTDGTGLYMTPALNANNFNWGENPTPIGARLLDIAAAQKTSTNTGQVLVIVR